MKTLFVRSIFYFGTLMFLLVLAAGLIWTPEARSQDACDMICYIDAFTQEDGLAVGWTPVGDPNLATWAVENGEYSANVEPNYFVTYSFLNGSAAWTDYKVEVSVLPIEGNWRAALVVRANTTYGGGGYDYYQIHTYPWGLRISKLVDGGTFSEQLVDFQRLDFYIPNTLHTLGVEAKGNELKFYYNGQLVIDVTDNGLGGYPPFLSGMIGLRVWGHSAINIVHFDDFKYCLPPTLTLLPPIHESGPNLFKLGRTIPVKFQLTDACGNSISNATAQLYVNGTAAASSGKSNYQNFFRYDSIDDVYIFNLSTKGLITGLHHLKIQLDDGAIKPFNITLQ